MQLLKGLKRGLQVKGVPLKTDVSGVLGSGIDVMSLPEGHLSCDKCGGHRFEAWVFLDDQRLEMGCCHCGNSYRLMFPMDVSLSPFGKKGRYQCAKHNGAGVILIHNVDVLSIGCEKCWREVRIPLRKSNGLIVADD